MLSIYPAIFYCGKNGSFAVVFPDFDNLTTCGENLTEAMEMATDCLAWQIYSAGQEGKILPVSTPVEDVKILPAVDYESAFVNLVAVDVEEYAAKNFEVPVKKTLTVPESLNSRAVELGINFSAVLKNRLMELCANPPKEKSSMLKFLSVVGLGAAVAVASRVNPMVAAVTAGAALGATVAKKFSERNVKKTLTLPRWLNERALAMNINFSAVLKDALIEACKAAGKK